MQTRKHALRFSIVFLTFIACLIVFTVKLFLIQFFNADHLSALAQKQHNHLIELESIRGSILDRNLRPLALNVSVHSLYANPRGMSQEDKDNVLKELPRLLDLDSEFVKERINRNKRFIWIKRKLPMEMVKKVKKLKLKGLDFINESKRYYPNKSLASHVIGFAGIDNQGLEGLELKYNSYLKGEPGWAKILRDAKQRDLMMEKDYILPKDGYHLVLTIDETIQYIVERALDKALKTNNAKAATVIVMDPQTGEVLALANRPSYNLENVAQSNLQTRTNRSLSFVYEPGSVLKVVTAAAALEEEKFIESDTIFCENGKYRIANHTLTDHRPRGKLSFSEVFMLSSNIGTVKVAQELGPDTIYKYGQRFRLGRKTGIDLNGEVSGWLKRPSLWSKTTIGAIPIGYEITTTPIQLVSLIASIANGGIYMQPYVVKQIKDNHDHMIESFEPKVLDRVISSDTALRITKILNAVVEEGTGQRAKIEGVPVAGKTGTARKVIDGKYVQGKYYSSFIGFAPANNPKLAAIVVFDEARPAYFGGTVAAPVFKEVVENSLKYLETSGI